MNWVDVVWHKLQKTHTWLQVCQPEAVIHLTEEKEEIKEGKSFSVNRRCHCMDSFIRVYSSMSTWKYSMLL